MPRPPDAAPAAAALRGNPYSSLLDRMAMHPGEVFPLHVGDTWRAAPAGCRPEELPPGLPGINRYTDVRGLPELRDAIAARASARTGVPVARANVLVTGGATAGLMAAVAALVAPGEEVLLLGPRWPLIEGHVRLAGATPVEIPLFMGDLTPDGAAAAVRARITEKTAAIYVNTPSNPTGRVLSPATVDALARVAREANLWLIADEVYELYAYAGPHRPAYGAAPERTIAAHSLSKAWGLAGARCGWLVGPEAALSEIVKFGAHTIYSAPTASQHAALRILAGGGDAWVAEARAEYEATGREAARRLGVPAPEGGTFLFLDVAHALDGRGLGGLLEDVAGYGLVLAPGTSFGPYPTHVRLCYTAVPPDAALRGVDVLAKRLGRAS
ncbi:MAG TPA: pyridoxal phosphate-dependent aminotransferase [Thermoanaerobaculia bacterium]|nr:pyridoxal phosphate-dependent aminotransferase [Thermoanaerobaculia bacterium]